MTIKRYALGIRYDGSEFHGWQSQEQDGLRTVQATVERAIACVADHPVHVICAGRTDAGVHAISQIIHFDTEANRSLDSWLLGINSNLPSDVGVIWVREVDHDFHARYTAMARSYRYLIYNTKLRPVISRQAVSWFYKPLDIELMQAGASFLLGAHDFSAFRARDCQAKTPLRCITEIRLQRRGPMVILDVTANAFLYHMVRNIVGVLQAVGCAEQAPGWVEAVRDSCDRRQAGVTATAAGLYLKSVEYPPNYDIPLYSVVPETFLD